MFSGTMATKTANEEMLTAAKAAKQLGVPPGAVKKAIAALGIEPDSKKGACSYYGPKTVKKIANAIKV